MSKTIKFLIIFSTVLSSWTIIVLASNTPFELELNEVIRKMYLNQKAFLYNVKDLSSLLVKDINIRLFSEEGEEYYSNKD